MFESIVASIVEFIFELCIIVTVFALLALFVFGIMLSGVAHNSVSMAQEACKCPKVHTYTKTGYTTKLQPEGHDKGCQYNITFCGEYIRNLKEIFGIYEVKSK
jgi:hypothetical protein